jgi:membrane protease YdiL (CAAX protease family)
METEEATNQAMKTLLQMDSFGILLYNVFLIAVLAAVGEELLFRGLLLRLLFDKTRNVHAAVWISSVIFSAIHLQFYGFFPRMLLGAYFGYLLWCSKSIWLPILAHFIYNATAVILSYLIQQDQAKPEWETAGANGDTWLAFGSLIIFAALLWQLRIKKKLKTLKNMK